MNEQTLVARLADSLDETMTNLLDSVQSFVESGALEHIEAILTDLELTEGVMKRLREIVQH